MTSYWLSFHVKDDAGYGEAYTCLTEAIEEIADTTNWWFETPSFYMIHSVLSIDRIARHIGTCIRPDRDLVVIGAAGTDNGRLIGCCEDRDIFALFPGMKELH